MMVCFYWCCFFVCTSVAISSELVLGLELNMLSANKWGRCYCFLSGTNLGGEGLPNSNGIKWHYVIMWYGCFVKHVTQLSGILNDMSIFCSSLCTCWTKQTCIHEWKFQMSMPETRQSPKAAQCLKLNWPLGSVFSKLFLCLSICCNDLYCWCFYTRKINIFQRHKSKIRKHPNKQTKHQKFKKKIRPHKMKKT